MTMLRLKLMLARFRDETRGSVTVETVIILPLLIWALVATYEFFELHRYKSARQKATYTIADLLSRETANDGVTSAYMDNVKLLFDQISNDDGANQVRISVVKYDLESDSYRVIWSKVRGTGTMPELQTSDVEGAHAELPIMSDGQVLVMVESDSTYRPRFKVGLSSTIPIVTRSFTTLRFAPQLCYESVCES